jgi:hypothetical protein
VLAALGVPAAARADVNVEGARAGLAQTEGLAGQLDLKFALRQGNVNVLDLGLASSLAIRRRRHFGILLSESRFAAQTSWRRGQTSSDLHDAGSRFRNRHIGHLRYGYRVLAWLEPETFTQLEADEFLIVRTRFLAGAGARFVVHEGEVVAAYVGTGYMPEYEALDRQRLVRQRPDAPARNWWHRSNSYGSIRVRATDRLRVVLSTYVQPRFDRPTDLRVSADGELAISLGEHWTFKLVAGLDYDSRPPVACAEPIPDDGVCAAGDEFALRPLDLSIENAINLSF